MTVIQERFDRVAIWQFLNLRKHKRIRIGVVEECERNREITRSVEAA